MEDFFGNIDIIKVLGFGLSGLSLLLMMLAYGLLRKVIATNNANQGVLSLIKLYMITTLVVIIIVGVFSFPIAQANRQLANDNASLGKQNQAWIYADNVKSEFDSIRQSKDPEKIKQHLKRVETISDSLSVILPQIDPKFQTDATDLKTQMREETTSFNKIAASNPSSDSLVVNFQRHASNLRGHLNNSVFNTLRTYARMKNK